MEELLASLVRRVFLEHFVMKLHVVKVLLSELFADQAHRVFRKGRPDDTQATAVHPSQYMAMKDTTN